MQWTRRRIGGYISHDGVWRLRGPIFGKPLWWVYKNGKRVKDCASKTEAMDFVDRQEKRV